MEARDSAPTAERRRWMAVLARASRQELEAVVAPELPDHALLKPEETGTVMIEGRAGGTGARFNLGEVTVTRCVVRLGGHVGLSYALGRDKRKARLAALIDAMLQDETMRPELERDLIVPLSRRQVARREAESRKAAATKVEFFTLVRGDG
jgi:alpha-D-ribose 1-methylphosphonate 5-triphosphate synthase subunit PhnG